MQLTWRSCTSVIGVLGAATLAGCGDSAAGRDQADAGGSSGSISATTADPSTSSSAGEASMSASGQSTTATSTTAAPDDSGSGDGPLFDLGIVPDVAGQPCGGKGGTPEFSFIWIANSGQGTISRINTQTMIEEGRYIVRPDSAGSPSRTSVSLSGDVAVANRNGGVTKVYANVEDCVESNGMPGIQTSSGAADILPWGTEECIAWHTPFAYATQRPVAWAPAPFDESTCTYQDQKLWTSGANGEGTLTVHRLDGETGAVEDDVPVPGMAVNFFGAYGGAVNGDGDLWITNYGQPPMLARVDAVTLDVEMVPGPDIYSYGFTVDSQGRPWLGGFVNGSARYSPDTGTWDVIGGVLGYGIQEDADGLMWLATFSPEGVRTIDSDSLALGAQINLPGSGCKGVSIDFFGYVWVVDMSQNAFRIDPATQQVDTYAGLTGPYTYSDMTGWGLSNVAFPPG